jgi:hypothetical protein
VRGEDGHVGRSPAGDGRPPPEVGPTVPPVRDLPRFRTTGMVGTVSANSGAHPAPIRAAGTTDTKAAIP